MAATPEIRKFQRSVVSAVYTDLQEKQRRSNNIIISGLKNTEYQDERAVVSGMICDEFNRNVTVKYCRRLGKKTTGRTQNLLVTLSSADDATFLVRNARMLRQSENDFVRSNIFINADLTPAEALAAYEARCVRRQRRAELQAKMAQKQPLQSTATGELAVGGSISATVTETATKATRTTRSTESSRLNPTTPSFTPLVVTADVHNSAE